MRGQDWLERIQKDSFKEEVLLEKGFHCAKCGTHKNLTIHHKKKVSKHPELKLEKNNVVILCENCHRKVHQKKNEGIKY